MLRISIKKQRDIPLTNFSLSGKVVSVKNNKMIDFESSIEKDYIYILEFDTNVETYIEQPIKLIYYDKNIKRSYIPDFYVKYRNGKEVLIEIKDFNDLQTNFKKYNRKFEAMEEFCKANNMEFKILTDKDIRTDYLFNAKFLLYYKNPFIRVKNSDQAMILQKIRKLNKKITISELLSEFSNNNLIKGELLYVLWGLLAKNMVRYNPQKKLNLNSEIWPT